MNRAEYLRRINLQVAREKIQMSGIPNLVREGEFLCKAYEIMADEEILMSEMREIAFVHRETTQKLGAIARYAEYQRKHPSKIQFGAAA